MVEVNISRLAKHYGGRIVLDGLSWQIGKGDKIGLVGANGSGKSTLFRLIAGQEEPDGGSIHRRPELTIGHLAQEPDLDPQRTVLEEVMHAFQELARLEEELRRLERRMVKEGTSLRSYGALLEQFEREGGYAYEAQIRQVLAGLGFGQDDLHRPVAQLSGGESTRACLARLLLEVPDMLLLDEPTNHLDLQAIEWLENRLASWPRSLVVVAHDRYFLDRVMDRIVELDQGSIREYLGNYSDYQVEKSKQST